MSNQDNFQNRAEFSGESQITNCDYCDDGLIFAMQDKNHEFSIGLLTILKCLEIAEKEGYTPKLPSEWWLAIERSYRIRS